MTEAAWFTRAFGVAVADARAALIEEGWFGRRESPRDHSLGSPPQESRQTPDAGRDPLGRTSEAEHEPQHELGHEPEYDPQREFEDGFRRGFNHGVERGSEPEPGHAFEIER